MLASLSVNVITSQTICHLQVHHSCSATVRALNASLSSNSLAAQAAAACTYSDTDMSMGSPEQRSPLQQQQHGGGPFAAPLWPSCAAARTAGNAGAAVM